MHASEIHQTWLDTLGKSSLEDMDPEEVFWFKDDGMPPLSFTKKLLQGCNSIDTLRMALTLAITIALSSAFLNASLTPASTCTLIQALNFKCLLNFTPGDPGTGQIGASMDF